MVTDYTLRLEGIRFRANIGASSSERAIPQELVVDVELTLPVASLPRRDHRHEVLDYDAVATLAVDAGLHHQHRLLETYVRTLVERLLLETPATRVRVAATKLRVPTRHAVDRAVVELIATRA
jgi:7,8-dihydroneopterin aldolase/epimerase/oxygenase